MILKDDEGNEHSYNVETFGNRLVLISSKGQWSYISDKPPVLISKVQKEIKEITDQLNDKRALLKQLKNLEVL
jgi:hypothetical protein